MCSLMSREGVAAEPVVTEGPTGECDSGTQLKVGKVKGDSRRQTRDSQPKVIRTENTAQKFNQSTWGTQPHITR